MFDSLLVIGYLQVQVDIGVVKINIFSAHHDCGGDGRAVKHSLVGTTQRERGKEKKKKKRIMRKIIVIIDYQRDFIN